MLVVLFKPAGYITDTFPAYITVPTAFLFRAGAILCFLTLDNPSSWIAYTVNSILLVGSLFENITIDGLFNKNLPKDIRGTLNSAYSFFGNVGLLIFTKIGGYIFDNWGASSPFILVATCDILFALLVISLRLCKKFN
jgi:predicted MFS family arabinose efflux permease